MTNKLKKKFLDYLQSKSAFYIYIKTYRDRHLSINPKEFTDYLCQTDPRLVITGAFTFPNSQLSYYDRKYWMKIHEGWMALLEKDSQEEELQSIIADVDFIDVEKRDISRGLGKDTVSLNMRHSYKLTFNQDQSKTIIDSRLTLAALGQSKTTGDILLMINGHRGISINVTETTKTRTSKNVVVGSKDFCSKLSKLLGIKTDYTLLDCRIFSQSANIIVFSINTKL